MNMSLPVVSAGQISAVKKKSEYTYKWEMNNFHLYCDEEVHTKIESPIFFTNGLKWNMYIYPKGGRGGNKQFLSVYLQSMNESHIEISYSLDILNNTNEKYAVHKNQVTKLFQPMGSWGRSHFIKHDALMDSKNNLLSNGKLTILCEIVVVKNCLHSENRDNDLELTTPEDPCRIATFCDLFSDIKFDLDGKIVYAHKTILANRSDIFAAMFEQDMKENSQNKVEINDIDYEVFTEMLRFIYTGKVNEFEKMAKSLLIVSEKYALEGLRVMCTKHLCGTLSTDNAFEYLDLADVHSIDELKTQAINFIVSRAEDIENFAGFKSITDLHREILFEVFHRFAEKKPKLSE